MTAVARFVLRAAAFFLVAAGLLRVGQGEYGMALADGLGAAIGVAGFGIWRRPLRKGSAVSQAGGKEKIMNGSES